MPLSIILPTYNERGNIVSLIKEIKKYISSNDEIIVVDDNSPDETCKLVHQLSLEDAAIRLINRTEERGLTSAIKTGIENSKNDIVLWMDADFSMPPSLIPILLERTEKSDIAIGSRYTNGGKDKRGIWLHTSLSLILNYICRIVLSTKIYDWTTGFVCARKSIFNKVTLNGDYGEYCIDFLYQSLKQEFTVKEIGYICINRDKGESKTTGTGIGFIQKGWKYIQTIIRLKFK